MMEKIYCTKNNWYYSDGTKIEFKYHNPPPVWVNKDGIIRLIDYDDKEEANKQIKRLYEVFYNVRIKKDQL